MSRKNAEELFERSKRLYEEGAYAESFRLLERLNTSYPRQRRILLPMAKCLNKMGRKQEAAAICDQLIADHDYPKAVQLKRVIEGNAEAAAPERGWGEPSAFPAGMEDSSRSTPNGPPPLPGVQPAQSAVPPMPPRHAAAQHSGQAPAPDFEDWDVDDEGEGPGNVRRILIWALQIVVAAGLVAGMYAGVVPVWLGIALLVLYALVMIGKLLAGRLLERVFSTPFKMKGMALNQAEADVHGVLRVPPPQDAEDPSYAYYVIDVTITPSPEGQQGSKFKHWEPGELALMDARLTLSSPKDTIRTYSVEDCQILQNGEPLPPEEEGLLDKVHGPLQLRLTVGMPPTIREAKFAYYFTSFGRVGLPVQ